MARSLEERYWEKVDVQGPEDCWLWLAGGEPYGEFTIRAGMVIRPHRLALALIGLEIPPGHHVHHACRNKKCVNPNHLEVVDPQEHHERHHGDTCINGHPWSDANTYWHGRSRHCRSCNRDNHRRSRKAKVTQGDLLSDRLT